jgi:hypothetical protein
LVLHFGVAPCRWREFVDLGNLGSWQTVDYLKDLFRRIRYTSPNSNKNGIQKSGTRITRPSDTLEKIRAVASAALALRALRHEIMSANG